MSAVSPGSFLKPSHLLGPRKLTAIWGQPVVKKLVRATGAENYNILQNNGRLAHQEVDHVRYLNEKV